MRILYLSCHSILEHDEIKLFRDLGHYVFSPGAYVEPRNPGDASMRPGIGGIEYDPEDLAEWYKLPGEDDNCRKQTISAEFVNRFDAVVVMHIPDWIRNNWHNLSRRPVVWRTIGQSISAREAELADCRRRGMKIVRYSPREATIPGYIGADAVIRFYKDPCEFLGWTGKINRALTVNQAIEKRWQACNFPVWDRVTAQVETTLMGPGNEGVRGSVGKGTFEEMKKAMRDHRAYFYVGTHPASYTLNLIEAMMTGIPIVALGPKLGNASYFPGHDLYEVPDLIHHGTSGLFGDTPEELVNLLKAVMKSDNLATRLSVAGRAAAVQHFGKARIQGEWKRFLETL